MSVPYLTFSCDSYKNVFSGFSRLQEQQEFVDLTLAADSHFVKVHKNIIALASPYLKEMLQMTSNPHPVIFLNNVSHKILCYLLEYIYQGEVSVPEDCIESFLQVSKDLHISGISNINQPQNNQNIENLSEQQVPPPVITLDPPPDQSFAAHITINSDHNLEVQHIAENVILPASDNNYQADNLNVEILQKNMPSIEIVDSENIPTNDNMEIDCSLTQSQSDLIKGTAANSQPCIQNPINSATTSVPIDIESITLDKEAADALKIISQYSISERGAVQIIVSRYIYCSHHSSNRGRKHRWRCIDYRKLRCPAYIDSFDGVITSRKGIHSHTFHDNKIYKKAKQKLIYHSIKRAMEARDLAQKLVPENTDDIENEIDINVVPKT